MSPSLCLLLTVATSGLATPLACSHDFEDRYYVIVYGAQRPILNKPRHTHSWATFIRRQGTGELEAFTISWLPENGKCRTFKPSSDVGKNFGLHETIDWCREQRMTMSMWGPYECDAELWHRALAQRHRLETGQVAYKVFDYGCRDNTISNCVHALAFIARQPGHKTAIRVLPANWGESGSFWIALSFRPWLTDPRCVHDELLAPLHLNPHDFVRNDLSHNPTFNVVTRGMQAMFHTYLLPNRVP